MSRRRHLAGHDHDAVMHCTVGWAVARNKFDYGRQHQIETTTGFVRNQRSLPVELALEALQVLPSHSSSSSKATTRSNPRAVQT
jgi:hypothetical protein